MTADFPDGDATQGTPSAIGSRMLQLAAQTDAVVADFVATRGIPDAIATSDWNTVVVLAYLDDSSIAIRDRGRPDDGVVARPMTEKERLWLQSAVSAEHMRTAMLWEPHKVIAEYARIYVIMHELIRALPEYDTKTYGYYEGFCTRPARGAVAADFGGDVGVDGEVIVWVDPEGPASGRVAVGDVITNRTQCASANGATPSPHCRQLTIVRQQVERQPQIELEVLPVQVYLTLDNATAANAWIAVTPEAAWVGITTGMLGVVTTDDELAFLLGHELGHLLPARRIYPSPTPASEGLFDLMRMVATALSTPSAHDREMDADRFALHLAHAAGYSPQAAIPVMSRISTMADAETYNLTHPPGEVRIAMMWRTLERLAPGRRTVGRSPDDGGGR